MCVIFNCKNKFPTEENLKLAEEMNPHGAGLSWIDNGVVKFKKGLDQKQISKMIKMNKVNLPCIIHFRIGTYGGISKGLTHPFPIDKHTDLRLNGEGFNCLFHNGNYDGWQDKLIKAMIKKGIKIPKGRWSDSRFMAFLASWHGRGVLELFDNQLISVMTKDGIEKYGDSWVDVDGIECSNNYFKRTYVYYSKDKSAISDVNEWNKEEKAQLNAYGKKIDKLSKQLLTASQQLKKIKKKGKRVKMLNKIKKLENKAIALTEEREDFIQNSETVNYDDIDEYRQEYNITQAQNRFTRDFGYAGGGYDYP